jgi:hypothetical protein
MITKLDSTSNSLEAKVQPSSTVLATPKYSSYLDPAFPLESRLVGAFKELGIAAEQQLDIQAMLAPLRVKEVSTYEHCVRVGLLARRIGSHLQLDQKALLYGGLLHDAGKALVPLETLTRTDGWSAADQIAIQGHVLDGFRLLSGVFDFTAGSILYHHRFQPNPYPSEMPAIKLPFSEGSRQLLEEYGRVIAIADTFDALHRINAKHGEVREATGSEIEERMLEFHKDRSQLIKDLFRSGILTTYIVGKPHVESAELDMHDGQYESSFRFTAEQRTPRNTERHLTLACALEPISDKFSATSRYHDVSPHLRIEYFIASAINIGDAFHALSQEISSSEILPANLYRYALQAQIESKRNRRGGRINQGMIELLTPIVVAQHMHDESYTLKPAHILELAKDYLQQADRRDVDSLIELKKVAYSLSHYHDRTVAEHLNAQSVLDYYQQELLHCSEKPTSIAHNQEFLSGFPTISLMTEAIIECPYPHFNQRVEEAFHRARFYHPSEVSVGFLADCTAVAIYLALSQNPRLRIVG